MTLINFSNARIGNGERIWRRDVQRSKLQHSFHFHWRGFTLEAAQLMLLQATSSSCKCYKSTYWYNVHLYSILRPLCTLNKLRVLSILSYIRIINKLGTCLYKSLKLKRRNSILFWCCSEVKLILKHRINSLSTKSWKFVYIIAQQSKRRH